MSQLVLMMILAVIFIYLIMVVQFQSLVSPFIIMFSIPLAFTGGFIALLLTGQEVNVLAMLGFIMLAGLIVNNGIVLIDYINQARKAAAEKEKPRKKIRKPPPRRRPRPWRKTFPRMGQTRLSTSPGSIFSGAWTR